ncbi:hypothetical protein C0J52_15777 [Blattella germanica]|nr:hypothetical protein C0J52_15777 [Blattella germanica]
MSDLQDNSNPCDKGRNKKSDGSTNNAHAFDGCESLTLLLKDKKWLELSDAVAAISKALSEAHNRECVTAKVLNNLSEVLEELSTGLKNSVPEIIGIFTEVFRALRNSCVNQPKNQKTIVENTAAVQNTCIILKWLISLSSTQENIVCLRVGTQFLGNLVVNNNETQPVIWNKCSNILLDLMKYEDDKIANYSSMVIYNILLGCPDITTAVEDYKEMLEILIEHAMKDSEFALFTVEMLLSRPDYLPKVYLKITPTHRLFLLDSMHSMITSESKTSIPLSSLMFLTERFKSQADCILKTCTKFVESLEPAEVSKMLQLLASACAEPSYQPELQKDKALLITCSSKEIYHLCLRFYRPSTLPHKLLLRSVHCLGKAGENNFSVIQKMADLSITSQNSDITEHPAFGFKSCLVQMLGNLCWKHLENQNQVRELDCISVLLDCCNIDARNPCILFS